MGGCDVLTAKQIADLGRMGIDASKELRAVASQVQRHLDELYRFNKPRTVTLFDGRIFFRTVKLGQVGPRQFVLEEGIFKRKFYRIRERRGLFPLHYFVWTHYDNREEALMHFENFLVLLEAREALLVAGFGSVEKED